MSGDSWRDSSGYQYFPTPRKTGPNFENRLPRLMDEFIPPPPLPTQNSNDALKYDENFYSKNSHLIPLPPPKCFEQGHQEYVNFLEEKNNEYVAQCKSITQELAILKNNGIEKDQKIKRLEVELKIVRVSKDNIHKVASHLEERHKSLTKQNASSVDTIRELSQEKIKLSKEIQDNEKEMQKLKEELESERLNKLSEISSTVNQSATLDEENKKLKNSISSRNKIIKKLEVQIEHLQTQLKTYKWNRQHFDPRTGENASENYEGLEKKCEKIKKDSKNYKKDEKNAENKCKNCENLDKILEKLQNFESENVSLKEENIALNQKWKACEIEAENTKKNIEEANKRDGKFKEENEMLLGRNRHLDNELKKFRNIIEKLEKQVKDTKVEGEYRIEKMKKEYEKERDEKNKILLDRFEKIKELYSTNEMLTRAKRKVEEKLENESDEKAKILSLKNKADKLVDELKIELDGMNKLLKTQAEEKEQIEKGNTNAYKALKLKYKKEVKEKEKLEKKLENELKEKLKIQNEKQQIDLKVSSLNIEIQEMAKKLENEMQKMEKHELEQSNANRIIIGQQKLINAHEETIRTLRQEIVDKNKNQFEISKAKFLLEQQIIGLHEKLEFENGEKEKIRLEKVEWENEVQKLKEELNKERDEKAEIQTSNSAATMELKSQITVLTLRNEVLKNDKENLKMMIENLETAMREKNKKLLETQKNESQKYENLKLKMEKQLFEKNEENIELKNRLKSFESTNEKLKNYSELARDVQKKSQEIAYLRKGSLQHTIDNVFKQAINNCGSSNYQPPMKKIRFEKTNSELEKDVEAYKITFEAFKEHLEEVYTKYTDLKTVCRTLVSSMLKKKCLSCIQQKAGFHFEISPTKRAEKVKNEPEEENLDLDEFDSVPV